MKLLPVVLASVILLLGLAAGVAGLWMVPRFADVFMDLEVMLPALTQIVVSLPALAWPALGLLVGAGAGVAVACARPPALAVGLFGAALLLLLVVVGAVAISLFLPLASLHV